MLRDYLPVSGISAPKQNSAVNFRMQRLHAPAQHFRPSGQFGHVAYGDSRIAQQPRRPSGRHNFNFQRSQLPRKFHQPRLVVDADQTRARWP